MLLISLMCILYLLVFGLSFFLWHNRKQKLLIINLVEQPRLQKIILLIIISLVTTSIIGLICLFILPIIWQLIFIIVISLIVSMISILLITNI